MILRFSTKDSSNVRSSLNTFSNFIIASIPLADVYKRQDEHWAFEPEVLNVYAKHYQTGEVIPAGLVEKMDKSGKRCV